MTDLEPTPDQIEAYVNYCNALLQREYRQRAIATKVGDRILNNRLEAQRMLVPDEESYE